MVFEPFSIQLRVRVRLALVVVAAFAVGSCARTRPPATSPAPPEPACPIDPVPSEVVPPKPDPETDFHCIEYPPVSLAEREGHRLELIEDLVVEERDGDARYNFNDAVGLAVDDEGRLYVHDNEHYRVVAYGPDGEFLREHMGTDEMKPFRYGWIAVAGKNLAISTGNKVTVWTLDGEYLYDRSLLSRAFSGDVQGTVHGNLVGSFLMLDEELAPWFRIEKIALDVDDSVTYSAVPRRRRGRSNPIARADFAATRTGEVYLTRGDEYVVQAFASDGSARWALYVDWPRRRTGEDNGTPPPPALAVQPQGHALARMGRGHPLRVDGHGNVYVFPYVDTDWDREEVPVDVYSRSGERIFAGLIPDRSWIRARGDHVFGIEYDEDTERQRIVRYRLRGLVGLGGD